MIIELIPNVENIGIEKAGPKGLKGDTGDKGWSPIFASVEDGDRIALQIDDWVGGEGTKPAVGSFLGPEGFVADIEDAVDFRGATGDDGVSITNATVNGSYKLIITFSDGSSVDAGYVRGSAGAAATVTVGTVTTLSPGAPATVTNVGTSSAAVLNFGIPKGDTGPITSVNGQTGPAVTGLAETATTYTKTQVDALLSPISTTASDAAAAAASAMELTVSVTASGALHAAKAALLRTDGKWEEIAGTVVDLAVGSDYDGAISAATSITVADAKYNATSGKVAILFSDNSNLYAVVASVSGNTLTFGSPVAFITGIDSVGSAYAHLVWNAAGTSLIVIGRQSSNNIYSLRTATISGTTINSPTAGTAVGTASLVVAGMLHDDTHGLRVVIVFTNGAVYYATYVAGTSQTVGTVGTTGMVPHVIGKYSQDGAFSFHYDEANYKLVIIDTTTIRILTGAASGTSWTVGAAAISHTAGSARALFRVATDKYVVIGDGTAIVASVSLTGSSATFSLGTLARFSASGLTASLVSTAMDPVSKEIAVVFMVTSNSTNEDYRTMGTILAVSGTAIAAVSDPVFLKTGYIVGTALVFAHPSGDEFALVYRDSYNYARYTVATLKKVSSAAKWGVPLQIRSDVPLANVGLFATVGSTWKLLATAIWGASSTVAPLNSCIVTLPSESTNADEWAGVPAANIADAGTGLMKLKGAVVDGFSGLTVGSTYYLKGDNTPSLVNNGREYGTALSATKMKLKVAA